MDRHPRIQPALYSVSITGPFEISGAGDTPSRRRIFTCHPDKASDQEAMRPAHPGQSSRRRAYRRPVTAGDLQVLTRFLQGRPGIRRIRSWN
jgi:hypothetical protein